MSDYFGEMSYLFSTTAIILSDLNHSTPLTNIISSFHTLCQVFRTARNAPILGRPPLGDLTQKQKIIG